MPTDSLTSLRDLEAAAAGLGGVAGRTPLLPVDSLLDRYPAGVWVKPRCPNARVVGIEPAGLLPLISDPAVTSAPAS